MMNRPKKTILNIFISCLLGLLLFWQSGLYLSPIKAHEASERSLHYGASEVVYTTAYQRGIYYLCRYDQWISVDAINKSMGLFWRFGSPTNGHEIDVEKPVDFTWSMSGDKEDAYFIVFGAVNDPDIISLEIMLDYMGEVDIIPVTELHDDLFMYHWKQPNDSTDVDISVVGYDVDGETVAVVTFP